MTFLCDKHYMQGTIVAMAAKMPEDILTEYGLLSFKTRKHNLFYVYYAFKTSPMVVYRARELRC